MRNAFKKITALFMVFIMAVGIFPTYLSAADTGDFTVLGGTYGIDYSYGAHPTIAGVNQLTILKGTNLTISNADIDTETTDTILVQSGITANITLNGVNIDVESIDGACAFEIAGSATANITLHGTNELKSGKGRAGIQVQTDGSQTATVNITAQSTGELQIDLESGIGGGAGIGGSMWYDGGNINIYGGTIYASGALGSAGIGGGNSDGDPLKGGASGTINIYGGNITAVGGNNGAGIGSGNGATSGINIINIHGGMVTAKVRSTAAGIGGGQGSPGGNITITGGTIIATGENSVDPVIGKGAGIGGGSGSDGGTIKISGGNIIATGGRNQVAGAGIGGGSGGGVGSGGSSGEITITGGNIIATSEHSAAIGAGGGDNIGDLGNIIISGGNISATSGIGIGIGGAANSGSFKTTDTGNAFIKATSISDKSDILNWSGIIFEGNNGALYSKTNSLTLMQDILIPSGKTLSIESGKTLTVENGKNLVVEVGGILNISDYGGVVNNGTIYNYGTINTLSNIIGSGAIYPQSDNPFENLMGTPLFLRENSGATQISYDNTTWSDYTGTVTLTGDTTKNTVTILSGEHDISFNNLSIDVSDISRACAFDIQNTAVANIILQGTSTLKSGDLKAGLQVQNSGGNIATVNIKELSTGSLFAAGGRNSAGIGGAEENSGGNITISGGIVTAQGGSGGAGIGGGGTSLSGGGGGGNITIAGGEVTGVGGRTVIYDGIAPSGIGGGQDNTAGSIVVSGGEIIAIGGEGSEVVTATGSSGYGIGSSITINGGSITATAGFDDNRTAAFYILEEANFTIPASSSTPFYSVSITAGDNSRDATAREISSDFDNQLYAKIAMSVVTPTVSLTPSPILTYTGKEQTQMVDARIGGATLTEGVHYTISGNTATDIGDYTLTVDINLNTNSVFDSTSVTSYIGSENHSVGYSIISPFSPTSPVISPPTGIYN